MSDMYKALALGSRNTPVATPPPPRPVPPPRPADDELVSTLHHPSVILAIGHRGSGKTALCVRIQERLWTAAPPWAIGLPASAVRLLPKGYGLAGDVNVIGGRATIYFGESYRFFHARNSQSATGRALTGLVGLSRQRGWTVIFDVQNPALLDRTIISEADYILIKEPGPFTRGFERKELQPYMDAARAAFARIPEKQRKRWVWLVAPQKGIPGKLLENELPSFWTPAISTMFADAGPMSIYGESPNQRTQAKAAGGTQRRGRPRTYEEKSREARALREGGATYGEIGRIMKVGKSQVFRYLHPL